MTKIHPRLLLAFVLLFAFTASLSAQQTAPAPAPSAPAPASSAPVQLRVPTANLPSVIYLMRHAEKPQAENNTDPDLTPIGFKRAELLPTLFVAKPGADQKPILRRPDVLFATARSKHSNRPVETITPLSLALNETINHDFEDHDTAGIAKEITGGHYGGKVVVICWHHGELPHLAEALGVFAAPHWDATTFNQIWRVQYFDGQARLTPMAEHLLPGDPETLQ